MKKTLVVMLLAGLAATCAMGSLFAAQQAAVPKAPQTAQRGPSPEDEERYMTALSSARRKLFAESMNSLSAPQLETFWGIYADYEKDKNALAVARVEVLKKFADSFGHAEGLSDADVTAAISDMAALQKKLIDNRMKYFDILSRRIDAKTAGRFALTDDYVTTAVRLDWLNQVPFPGDEGQQAAPAK
jgi:hypothetical protein